MGRLLKHGHEPLHYETMVILHSARAPRLTEGDLPRIDHRPHGRGSLAETAYIEALATAHRPPWELAVHRRIDEVSPHRRTYTRASRRHTERADVCLPAATARRAPSPSSSTPADRWKRRFRALGAVMAFARGAGIETVRVVQGDTEVASDEVIDIDVLGSYRVAAHRPRVRPGPGGHDPPTPGVAVNPTHGVIRLNDTAGCGGPRGHHAHLRAITLNRGPRQKPRERPCEEQPVQPNNRERHDNRWWEQPHWWALEKAATATSRNELVKAWRIRSNERALAAGVKPIEATLYDQELNAWLSLLGRAPWVREAYTPEVAVHAVSNPEEVRHAPDVWAGLTVLICDYADPLAVLTTGLVNPSDVTVPKDLPGKVFNALRDALRRYIAGYARRELVGDPSHSRTTVADFVPRVVLASAEAAEEFLADPDKALATTRVAARHRLIRRVQKVLLDYEEAPHKYEDAPNAERVEEVVAAVAEFRDTLIDAYGAPDNLARAATDAEKALVRDLIAEFLAANPTFATNAVEGDTDDTDNAEPTDLVEEPSDTEARERGDVEEQAADRAAPVVAMTLDGDRRDLIGAVVLKSSKWMLDQVVVGFTPDAAITMKMMLGFVVKDWRRERNQRPRRAKDLMDKLKVALPPEDGRRTIDHDPIGNEIAGRSILEKMKDRVNALAIEGFPSAAVRVVVTAGSWEHLTAVQLLDIGPHLLAVGAQQLDTGKQQLALGFTSLGTLIKHAWENAAQEAGATRPDQAVNRSLRNAATVITELLRVAAAHALSREDAVELASPDRAPDGTYDRDSGIDRWSRHAAAATAALDELRGGPAAAT